MTVFASLLINDASSLVRLYWYKWCFFNIIIIQSRLGTGDLAATPFQSAGELTVVSIL